MQDIVTGFVKKNGDEEHRNMVQVDYYLEENRNIQSEWMPVMTPYTGAEPGMHIMPEIGTEVVVGFRFGDRNKPFVLGALWENFNVVSSENDEERGSQVFDMKEKVQIHLNGEEYLTLEKGKVTFAGRITVSAEEIVLKAEKSISVESGQTMTLKPDQKLVLKGQNIEISPEQGFKLGGMKADIGAVQQINLKTQQLKMEGTAVEVLANASLKLRSDGITEIKGAMVKLN